MRSYSITRYRKLLLELGFRDRATADLTKLAQDFSTPRRRALAARELAFLGLAAGGALDHQAALDSLELALTADADEAYRRAATILAAEAHLNLGKGERAQAILNEHLASDACLDLYLGLANCLERPDEKLALVNNYMRAKGLADVSLKQVGQAARTYDRLTVDVQALKAGPEAADQPLVVPSLMIT